MIFTQGPNDSMDQIDEINQIIITTIIQPLPDHLNLLFYYLLLNI